MGGGCFKPKVTLDPEDVEPPWMRWRSDLSPETLVSVSAPSSTLKMTACTASLVAALEGAGATSPTRIADPDAAQAANEKLGLVLQAAGRPGTLDSTELEHVIAELASFEPCDVVTWLAAWVARNPAPAGRARSRAGLLGLMQQVLASCLEKHVEAAEAVMTKNAGCDFSRAVMLCEETLTLDGVERRAVYPAALWLACAAGAGTCEGSPPAIAYMVPALDRLVLLFRHSLLSDLVGMPTNRHRWRELEEECGLPAIERHLSLLGCGAKAVMLAMLMVPEGVPPVAMVVNRGSLALDIGFPTDAPACVLSPYFESPTGTKIVHGRRVEGGEGHGPRKEFFTAASLGCTSRWTNQRDATATPLQEVEIAAKFMLEGSSRFLAFDLDEASCATIPSSFHAVVLRCLESATVGDQLRLDLADGSQVQATVAAAPLGHRVEVREILRLQGGAILHHLSLSSPVQPLFEFHRGSGQHWFGAYADEVDAPGREGLRMRYFIFGKLLALAVTNHCKISFTLPAIFFGFLLHRGNQVPVLDDLRGFDDDLWQSLRKLSKMRNAQFKALKELEGLPNETTRDEYAARRVSSTLAPAALAEVKNGFWSCASSEEYWSQVSAAELRHILCPAEPMGTELAIRNIFEVFMDEDLTECPVFVDVFWSVVDNFKPAERRQFLLFVTGVENPPEPGTERLHIELAFHAFSVEEHERILNMLPQAHTCSNCLELPNYYEALQVTGRVPEEAGPEAMKAELWRVLERKLHMAISETGGYELDATECEIEPLMCTLPKAAVTDEWFRGEEELPLGPDALLQLDGTRGDEGYPVRKHATGLVLTPDQPVNSGYSGCADSYRWPPADSARDTVLVTPSVCSVESLLEMRGLSDRTLHGAVTHVDHDTTGGYPSDLYGKAVPPIKEVPLCPQATSANLGVDDLLDELGRAMSFDSLS